MVKSLDDSDTNNEEEDALADHLNEAASIGYGSQVKLILNGCHGEKCAPKGLCDRYLVAQIKKRQPKLSL